MDSHLLQTKLHVPPVRREYVPRPRLYTALEVGLACRLILLSAPAGYGKTTLLSDWTSRLDLPCAWLSLDRYDNDLVRFLEYLFASLQKIGVKIESQPSIQAQSHSDLDSSFLVSLINDIISFTPGFVLILDDYHRIQNEQVHRTVGYLLDNLPPDIRLVIATRIDPPLRLARLRAQGALYEIRAEELRFTEPEAITFLNRSMKLGLIPSDITTLTWKTEGWITGLQLAAISLKDNPEKGVFLTAFAGDDRHVADYLMDEALARQSSKVQDFLLRTAILDRLSAPLCDAVTGNGSGRDFLTLLEQSNLFLIPQDNVREWYRYHHLFQDLLQNRLLQNYPSGTIKALHLRASDWYLDHSMIFEAIYHAFKAEDMLRIVRLVESHIFTLLDQGGIRILSGWIDSIPRDIKADRPLLNIANALLHVYVGDLDAGENALDQAQRALSRLNEAETLQAVGFIKTIRAYALWMKGEAVEAGEFASQALVIIPEEERSLRAFAFMVLGGAQVNNDEMEAARHTLNESIALARTVGNHHIRILASGHLIFLLNLQGKLSQAEKLCQDIFDDYEGIKEEISPAIAQIYTLMGDIHAKRMELDLALEFVKKGLEISKRWDQIDTITLSYIYLIDVLIARGAIDQAAEVTAEVKALSLEVSPWFREIIEETETRIQLYTGNLTAASRWVIGKGLQPGELIGPTNRNTYRTYAQILMAEGRLPEAGQLLDRMIEEGGKNIPFNHMSISSLLKSLVMWELGEEEEAFTLFCKTLQQAEPEGHKLTFVLLGKPLIPLLRRAIDAGIQPIFALELMETIAGKDFHQPGIADLTLRDKGMVGGQFLEPLSQREIEVLQWMAEGCTNQEIANKLILSLHTVKSHARNIYGKLGVKNRTEAVARSRLLGLLE